MSLPAARFQTSLYKIARRNAPAAMLPTVRTSTSRKILSLKNEMIADFLNHPVTKEILAGPKAQSRIMEYGNLYSFLGLDANEDHIGKIVNVLQEKTGVSGYRINNRRIYFDLNFPTSQDVFAVTPLPWTKSFSGNRSWAQSIEQGVSGVGYYLYFPSKYIKTARSKRGIQIKKRIRSGKFQNIKYISSFLNEWYRKMKMELRI